MSNNIVLGKGKLYFNPFATGTTTPTGEIYLAQSRELSYSAKADTLDHYDADEGMNVLDEQVQTKVDLTGKTTVEHISMENLALFLQANGVTTVTTTAGTALTETVAVKRGRFYQLGVSDTNPVGVTGVTNVSAKKGGTAVTQSGNYTVDLALGRIYIEAAATGIADNDSLTLQYDVAAASKQMVVSKDQQIRGSLRFISANPVGEQKDYFFPYVNMQPDGDYALKGDAWQTMGFAFTALKKGTLERVYITSRS